MKWHISLVALLALSCYISISTGYGSSLESSENYEGDAPLEENYADNENLNELNTYDKKKLEKMGDVLIKLLIAPWPNGSPLLYVEGNPEHEENILDNNSDVDEYETFNELPSKRNRYYRKYPWKRHNSSTETAPLTSSQEPGSACDDHEKFLKSPRKKFDPGNRFLCTPSKEDIYRLLVALHKARQRNRDQVINFCNRKRPATSIFTNIRLLRK